MEIQIKTQINQEVLNREIEIVTQDDYQQSGDVLKLCKNKIKELETERKTYTQPLDESKKLIMAKFNETINPIKDYIEKLNRGMSNWFVIEEKRRQEEQKELEEKAIEEAGDNPDVIVPVVESAKTIKGGIATTSMTKTYDFEIEDETLIPREYLMPDEKKIKADIKKGVVIKGIKTITGFKPKSY